MSDQGLEDLRAKMQAHDRTASWAVWEDDDITFPASPQGLHNRAIIIAGNPGNAAADAQRPAWTNFHTGRRHNDHLLAHGFRGTELWGAYMTDLLTQVESDIALVDGSSETLATEVERLADELEPLKATDALLVLVGSQAMALVKPENLAIIARSIGVRPEEVRWINIPHYSGSNSSRHGNDPDTYREAVKYALAHPGQKWDQTQFESEHLTSD